MLIAGLAVAGCGNSSASPTAQAAAIFNAVVTAEATPTEAPTEAPAETPTLTAPGGSYFQYTIRPGDQWWAIARYFNITVCELSLANPQIKDTNHLEVGWVLNVPSPAS